LNHIRLNCSPSFDYRSDSKEYRELLTAAQFIVEQFECLLARGFVVVDNQPELSVLAKQLLGHIAQNIVVSLSSEGCLDRDDYLPMTKECMSVLGISDRVGTAL
jgi:hypothetical protein